MTVLSVIFGIILIIGGFSCMFTPLATLLATGYIVGIMMLIYGIIGIARGFRKEADTLEVVLAVLAVIVGLVSMFRPGTSVVFDSIMIFVFSAWILLQGIGSIVMAIRARNDGGLWILGLISGILGVALGIYSFLHPTLAAVAVGILIGFYFVETGINMIVLSSVIDRIQD